MKTDPKPAYWAVIPAEVRQDTSIPANAKLIYGDISALCNTCGYCYACNEYFCDLYAWSERTVQRLISALADRGYIRVEMEPGKERRIYAGAFLGISQGGDKIVTPDNFVVGGRQKSHPHNKEDNTTVNNPPKSPKGGGRKVSMPKWRPKEFVTFWTYYSSYGRGDDRAGAVREWDRLKPDDDLLHVIGQALGDQARSDEWQRGYAPYARTWLHNRRWEDMGRKPTPPAGATPGAGGDEECMVGSDLPQW